MKWMPVLLISLSLLIAGCASSRSPDVYTRDQARQPMKVTFGVVESVRPVTLEGTKSPVGAVAGGVIGGIAGSTVGGGKGSEIIAVLGAVAGGIAGAVVEEQVTRDQGLEITVRLDNGEYQAVVQSAEVAFQPGQRVRILSNYRETRVAPIPVPKPATP